MSTYGDLESSMWHCRSQLNHQEVKKKLLERSSSTVLIVTISPPNKANIRMNRIVVFKEKKGFYPLSQCLKVDCHTASLSSCKERTAMRSTHITFFDISALINSFRQWAISASRPKEPCSDLLCLGSYWCLISNWFLMRMPYYCYSPAIQIMFSFKGRKFFCASSCKTGCCFEHSNFCI